MKLLALNFLALMPKANSDYAFEVDALYWYLNIVTAFFTILIAALVVFFCIKYARKDDSDRPAEIHGNNFLEITWSVIPFLFMLVMFVWGTSLHYKATHAPADAMEILITGKQWMWKAQHPNGKREINDLHVPQGVPIKLTITSEDVIHSYYIPVQRLKRDAVPGRYTTYWFEADDVGVYHIFCAEYCGAEHSLMKGSLYVMPESEYNAWLETGHNAPTIDIEVEADVVETKDGEAPPAPPPAKEVTDMGMDAPSGVDLDDADLIALGEKTFNEIGCMACHPPGAASAFLPKDQVCPDLKGWYGGISELNDGTRFQRGYEYTRESIRKSQDKIVKGHLPGRMPNYDVLLNDNQINGLVAWIKSLSEAE